MRAAFRWILVLVALGCEGGHPRAVPPPPAPPAARRTERPTPRPSSPDPPPTPGEASELFAQVGEVRGTVWRIHFATGRIEIATGSALVRLEATPAQLAPLVPGRLVELRYARLGGHRWLLGGATALVPSTFTSHGARTGEVTTLDRAAGRVGVGGLTLRAHPIQLARILPGEFVRAEWIRVGGTSWLFALAPATPAPSARRPRR